ncbi:hypothetical protein YPPY66_2311 [Yersinia pestis PY-66]|uniref:Uncharacterized protein n=2 Tax=Yersinia pseudotuberculosis complex TaxID=1649845 RepID=A0A0U1R0Z1_YERP3|nr:hypothetical protein YpsIP31758_2342 [Yersinia pseudotuberculosis IP 31758]EIQ89552.1 hypothetical protein YPPY01_2022 [Yersinia pestis PY-01]EIQ90798.1 hypothetical protein YPPY02_2057 [Yersinia pestis PY-02]EIR03049.1 hypothetical protein YPPY04_2085 [Yersinia pestis PY-04]EIR04583.1 hypothetical protein YPPY05_2066 [Yersinia pestis PY-05]EIR18549.1 hypothetical protein YPPY07_1994 [Yersinia pestis PY-07]EIR19601.1 hypothetical protein YPPY08_2104 [Yersinia pestis PY-08]EIR21297.1 hypot
MQTVDIGKSVMLPTIGNQWMTIIKQTHSLILEILLSDHKYQ